MSHPLSDFESNTLDNIRVLDSIQRYNNGCRYLHISSAAVYGNPEKLPISEGDRKVPMSPYGWHKLMAEQICSEYHLVYGISTAIVRPFSVYGNGLRKQLLWDICTKVQSSDTVNLYGTGNESRDFIHVSDLVVVIGKIIDNSPFTCNVYNAASGTETRISQIAGIFEQHFQGKKKMLFSGEEKKGIL
jgi:dTDP-glucose 4,6-dehydratase/UDP-glucose 4-epimerase